MARPDGSPGLLVVPPGFSSDRTLGWQVAHYIETFLCHGPGDLQGEPLEVGDELAAFLALAYGLSETGHRLVHEATLSRCKGWSKSEKAGAVVVAEFVGPVRFDHWAKKGETSWWGYEYEKGEPVGAPIKSPFIRCLATEEEQSGNTYDNVTVMLEYAQERHPDIFGGIDYGRTAQTSTRIFLRGGGEIRPSTAASASKDGGKESFVVGDEPHLWHTRELKAMDATVSRNLPKRPIAEPWKLYTTTMYCPGEDSVAELGHKQARQIARRELPNRGILFDHREGPSLKTFDWDDDDALLEALRVAAGEAEWTATPRRVAEVRGIKTAKSDAVRYFLNLPTKGERQGIEPDKWDALARHQPPPSEGTCIGLGFDGSVSGDATALVGCTREGHKFALGWWERPEGPSGKDWKVPRLEVRGVIREAFAYYRVGRMYYDPWRWETEGEEWVEEFGDEVVVSFPTNQTSRFAPACSRFATAVERGEGSHDGDPRLRAHVLAMVRRKVRVSASEDDGRTAFVFDKGDTRKIDGGIAATLAEEAAMTMPEPVVDEPSVLIAFS